MLKILPKMRKYVKGEGGQRTGKMEYTKSMDIEFRESAFRHRISEADIRHAFLNPYYDGPIENGGNKSNRYIRLGFDKSGNLLEILYNEYDDHVCIFHAMRCRNIFFYLLES